MTTSCVLLIYFFSAATVGMLEVYKLPFLVMLKIIDCLNISLAVLFAVCIACRYTRERYGIIHGRGRLGLCRECVGFRLRMNE